MTYTTRLLCVYIYVHICDKQHILIKTVTRCATPFFSTPGSGRLCVEPSTCTNLQEGGAQDQQARKTTARRVLGD